MLVTISMIANGSHPLRALLFLIIVGEPLLVVWAIIRWGKDLDFGRVVGSAASILLAIQVPVGIWQGLTVGWEDPVHGTMTGNGAGSHILGGILALGLLVVVAAVIAGRLPRAIGLLGSGVMLGMILAVGANQVVIASAVALLMTPLVAWPRGDSDEPQFNRWLIRIGASIFSLLLAISGLLLVELHSSNILNRAQRLDRPGQLPEESMIEERTRHRPLQLLIGSGPGTTASRAALLLTPSMLKESSPLAALHLPPTPEAVTLVSQARTSQGGSAESVTSGTLGILGDLGLLGLGAQALLLIWLWRHVGALGSWLTPAARASLMTTAILLFVDNWLEYPEYSVLLAILLSYSLNPALSGEPTVWNLKPQGHPNESGIR
jgi:hypothetical protein